MDKESTCTLSREEVNTMNRPMGNSTGHVYQNCLPKSEYDDVRLKPTSRKAKRETRPTSYHQETVDTRELETEYANAEILENAAV